MQNASIAKTDITALLPASENEFAFGKIPTTRSALAGTAAAERSPHLVSLQSQSLFATLVQAHDLWGTIARQTYRGGQLAADGTDLPPWDSSGRFKNACVLLTSWEQNLPQEFRFSKWNLRGFKAEHVCISSRDTLFAEECKSCSMAEIHSSEKPSTFPVSSFGTVSDTIC